MNIRVFTITIMFFSTSAMAEENTILNYFQKENPDITEVQILEYVSNYYLSGGLMVARGIKPANNFTGNWSDELFGIFHTNKDMKILKALEFIPTKRWYDYCVEVNREKHSHYIVRFYGCSYSDSGMIKKYNIE